MGIWCYLHRIGVERLAEILRDPANLPYDELADANDFTVEKTWNAIEFLLVRLEERGDVPSIAPLTGGVEFGDNLAYGPARYLTADEVKLMATALSSISVESLGEVFDLEDLEANNVYPGIWKNGDRAWLLNYVCEHFLALVRCYSEAANAGDAMLLYFS